MAFRHDVRLLERWLTCFMNLLLFQPLILYHSLQFDQGSLINLISLLFPYSYLNFLLLITLK